MAEKHEFEFETAIIPAEARGKLETANTTSSNSANADNHTTEATPAPLIGSDDGIVAALQTKFEVESQAETQDGETQLLLLGAALYTYDVWSLPALLENADADPDPPACVEAVLPFTRQLVER